MIHYKILAATFILLTPLFGIAVVKLFSLDRFKINFADIALPLFIFEMFILSRNFFTYSVIPFYIIIMSLLAIVVTIGLLRDPDRLFTYRRFLKFFWRTGFILTFFCYIGIVIVLFLL